MEHNNSRENRHGLSKQVVRYGFLCALLQFQVSSLCLRGKKQNTQSRANGISPEREENELNYKLLSCFSTHHSHSHTVIPHTHTPHPSRTRQNGGVTVAWNHRRAPIWYDWLTYAQLRTHICPHLMVRLTETRYICLVCVLFLSVTW